MSIVKGVFATPQSPKGVKSTMVGGLEKGRPADPHFKQYTQSIPVTLLRAYHFNWRGERKTLSKGAQVYLIAWPGGEYHLVENPVSAHHFDDTPTEGVDFTF